MLVLFRKLDQKRKVAVVSALACGVYIVVAIATHVYVHAVLLPTIHQASADLDRLEPRIIADFKLLSEKPIYSALPREKNAEHFLSGFISWSGSGVRPLTNPEHDRLMTLMKSHERAASTDETWAAFLADDSLSKLDLAWVDQLVAYDHIDFGTHQIQADLLNKVEAANGMQRVGIAANLPLPEMRELRFAALARVAQLQKENRLAEAPGLYRHVSYLFASTDSLIGSLVAATLLQTEKSLAERTRADWQTVDENLVQAFKRSAWAWIGIEHLRASKENLGSFEPYLNRATGACSGAFETIGFSGQLQDYFAPTALFESDLHERLAKIGHFQRRLLDLCEHEQLKVFLAPVPSEANPLIVERFHPNMARIPFVRRIVGLNYLASLTPNYFNLYEQNPREPASK